MKLRFNTFRIGLPNGLIFGFQTFAVMVVARNKDRKGRRTGKGVKKTCTILIHIVIQEAVIFLQGFLRDMGKLSKTVVECSSLKFIG